MACNNVVAFFDFGVNADVVAFVDAGAGAPRTCCLLDEVLAI